MAMGKQVPVSLIKQIEEDKKQETQEDTFNNFRSTSSDQGNKVQIIQQQRQQQRQQPPHKFSPQYAAYIGSKPRAQASARVGLGGVF